MAGNLLWVYSGATGVIEANQSLSVVYVMGSDGNIVLLISNSDDTPNTVNTVHSFVLHVVQLKREPKNLKSFSFARRL